MIVIVRAGQSRYCPQYRVNIEKAKMLYCKYTLYASSINKKYCLSVTKRKGEKTKEINTNQFYLGNLLIKN